jgi:hypothetical protein
MKKVLAVVLALGMTSTAFGMENVRDAERDELGVITSAQQVDSQLLNTLAEKIAEILLKNEATRGDFEHQDDNGRGR